MKHVVVELDTGEQEFFDHVYDAFRFAKEAEARKRHSVDYVAIGDFGDEDGIVYRGQRLRNALRMLDDLEKGLKAQINENVHDMDSRENHRGME